MNSELIFTVGLPNIKNKKNCILIYDKILTSKKLTTWIQTFPNKYGVHSGESLKETKNFHQHIQKILKLSVGISKQEITIVALGGGSIGDFSGFVASVLKRGVRLVHVPSTWLSAIDSAHGGKTALNAGGIKNQIGTFYPAQKTYISKKILFTQPEIRLQDAWGEALKTALLSGPGLYKKLLKKPPEAKNIWPLLPKLISFKYKIVELDPFEQKGIRHILNLGHTIGHAIESEKKITHGQAVLQGLSFSVNWSKQLGLMSAAEHKKIIKNLPEIKKTLHTLRAPQKYLSQDKKVLGKNKISFIFLKGIGKPAVKQVTLNSILKEIKRQAAE